MGDRRWAGGLAGVCHREDEGGAGEHLAGAQDAGVLEEVLGRADACGIDEADGDAAEIDDFLEGVAGGAGEMADDGALVTEEAIEQAGFAGIGRAADDGAQALAEDVALISGAQEPGDLRAGGIDAREELRARRGVDVLVGEIDVGLDVGEDAEEALAQGDDVAAEAAFELLGGGAEGEICLSADEVHDRLGLGEVHFSVEEGAPCEFAGVGEAGAAGEEEIEYAPGDENAAVALNLDDVLAGVAGGCAMEGEQDLIQHLRAIDDAAELLEARGQVRDLVAGTEYVAGDADRVRPAEPEDGDGGLAKGRRDSGNGIAGKWMGGFQLAVSV